MVKQDKTVDFLKLLLLIFNIISIIIFVVIAVLSTSDEFSFVSIKILSYILIGIQSLTLLLTNFYEKKVENTVFELKKSDYIRTVIPIQKESEAQIARNELRFGLNIIIIVSTVITIFLCLMLKSFLPFLASICLLGMAYMYSDYVPHAITYARRYDANFSNITNGNSIRGLARIYLDEYTKTKFKRKNPIYKKAWKYEYDKKSLYQDDCIKCILQMKADSISGSSIIYSSIIVAINIVLILPGVLEFITSEFIAGNSKICELIRLVIFISINITFAIINIISIFTKIDKEENVLKIYKNINSSDSCERFNFFRNLCAKNKIIMSRGIYVYCSKYIDNFDPSKSIDKIDFPYRILFTHKYYANIPRYIITVILSLLSLSSILILLKIDYLIIMYLLLSLLLICAILGVFWLPHLGECIIKKMCKELIEAQFQKKP